MLWFLFCFFVFCFLFFVFVSFWEKGEMGERRPLTVLDNLDRDSEEKTESESPYFVQHQHSFDKPKRKGTKRNELEKALADVQHYKRKLALAEEKLKGIEKRLNFEQVN